MPAPISLVQPDPNKSLVEALKAILEQAERGEFTRCVIVKLKADLAFAVQCVGVGSDLAMAGALAFAQHDLMTANIPKDEP